jgi:hypothetical protein
MGDLPVQDIKPEEVYKILEHVSTPEQFCIAHELVNKFKITSKHHKILRETKFRRLRAFRFLLCKN